LSPPLAFSCNLPVKIFGGRGGRFPISLFYLTHPQKGPPKFCPKFRLVTLAERPSRGEPGRTSCADQTRCHASHGVAPGIHFIKKLIVPAAVAGRMEMICRLSVVGLLHSRRRILIRQGDVISPERSVSRIGFHAARRRQSTPSSFRLLLNISLTCNPPTPLPKPYAHGFLSYLILSDLIPAGACFRACGTRIPQFSTNQVLATFSKRCYFGFLT
jgi:hypothetical protein